MSSMVGRTPPLGRTASERDYLGGILTGALILVVAVYTTTWEQIPALNGFLAGVMAGLSLLLAYLAAVLHFRKALPLIGALTVITVLTAILNLTGTPQDFNVLLRYLTSTAGLFAMSMIPMASLTRLAAGASMGIIAYAGYVSATAGEYLYAGTVRATPFWAGPANTSYLVSALIIIISLSPLKRVYKLIWVSSGIFILVGFGVVTPVLMVALFFAGWYFLHRGWRRVWLYIVGSAAVLTGIYFRNSNSVEGGDIATLGVGAVGSGRLDAWTGRLTSFAERDPASMLLGLGPRSDYQTSSLWFWEEKNAHSDLITILMEFGIIGFLAFLILGITAYRGATNLGQVAILSVALGAMASNTFIDRPAVAIFWGVVLYACRHHIVKLREDRSASSVRQHESPLLRRPTQKEIQLPRQTLPPIETGR